MSKSDWIWMPHAAHCIIGSKCRYHMATYVKGFIVSTIGEYWLDYDSRRYIAKIKNDLFPDKKIDLSLKGDEFDYEYMRVHGFEELGWNRLYETMVFEAESDKERNGCCPYVMKNPKDLDFAGYMTAKEATDGHYAMCYKWECLSNNEKLKIIEDCQNG